MPFSLGNYTEYASFYALGSANGNSLCIEHCLTAVNKKYEDSRIAIIVPEGILFDRKFTKLRKHIYQNSYVENIISLPTGTFAPYSNVKTSIIYLTRKKNEQKFIWHYEVKNDGYTLNTKREKKEGKNDLDTFLSFRDSSEEEKLSQDGFSKLDMKLVEENDYISIPNVYKKFAFDTKHKIIPLGELVEEVNLRNQDNFPVWSVTNDEGFMLAEKRFSERVASDNTSNYKIVPPNYFAYSPPRINVGSINYNNTINTGCVSPLYVVFKVKKEEIIIPKYLFLLFQSEEFKEQVKSYAFGSVRQTLSFENFVKITVPVPFLEEQEKVITELTNIKKMIKNAGEIIKELNNRLSLSLSLSLSYGETTKIRKLGEICSIRAGKTPSTKIREYWCFHSQKCQCVNWYTQSEIIQNKLTTAKKITQQAVKKYNLPLTALNSVFLCNVTNFYPFCPRKSNTTCNQQIFILEPNLDYIYPSYLYCYLLSSNDKLLAISSPNNFFSSLRITNLNSLNLYVPSLSEQQKIVGELNQERRLLESQKELVELFKQKEQKFLSNLWRN